MSGGLDLILFAGDDELVRRSLDGGVTAVIADWENRGKAERQADADTEINAHGPAELEALVRLAVPRRFCRVNALSDDSVAEIDRALAAGATDLLLPMARGADDAAHFLEIVGGRARAGILVETAGALGEAEAIALLPLDRIYIGFNDLAIDRGTPHLFTPLADGALDALAGSFAAHRFGFGGVTVVDGGAPIPCRLLMGEMARTGATFSFLRRAFRRDVKGRDVAAELARIAALWERLLARSPDEVDRDRAELLGTLAPLLVPRGGA